MAKNTSKSDIISLQESLRYFMTSDQAVLFLVNRAPEAATRFVQKCAKEAKLLADCFYYSVSTAVDTEALSAQLQQLGLNISLPNFSSGAQLEFCLEQVRGLKAPSVLIIDRADRLPPMTLTSLYQLATDQTNQPLHLHIILMGAAGIEKIAENFTHPRLKNPVAVLQFDPNDEALEDPDEDGETRAPLSFWDKHKIKIISLIVLIVVLFGFRSVENHINQNIGGIGERSMPSLPIPAVPKPPVPVAPKTPLPKTMPAAAPSPATKTETPPPTSTNLAPRITAELETQPAPVPTAAPVGWPGEKISTTPSMTAKPAVAEKIQPATKPVVQKPIVTAAPTPIAASKPLYTIQWIASPREDTVTRFQTKNHLESETFMASKTAGGKTWYFLLEGKFTSPHEAMNTADSLKARIPNASPWVRKWSFDQ